MGGSRAVGPPGELGHKGMEERGKKVCRDGNSTRAEVMFSFFFFVSSF
jgi:hypothetical protein